LERVDIGCAGKAGALGFEAVLPSRGHQQACPLCGKGAGGGEADAGAGAGDEGDLLCKVL
jgi:hypothetical protein